VEGGDKDPPSDWHCEVTQWSTGTHIVEVDKLMATIRLHSTPSYHLTVVCCGPTNQRHRLFYFQVKLTRIGADFHRSVVAAVPGELLIGSAP